MRAALLAFFAVTATTSIASGAAFPTLKQALDRARDRGPAAMLAAADVKVAGAAKSGAGLPPLTNPYLEVFVDRGSTTVGPATLQANLWLPVEISGQRSARLSEVDALVAWKKGALEAAAATAVGEAASAWGDVVVADARRRHATSGEKIAKDEAAYVAGRFEAKDATAVDDALAKGEVARWTQMKAEADVRYALAKARLAIAIGDPDMQDPVDAPSVQLPELAWKDGDALAKFLLEHSPVLRAGNLEATYFLSAKDRWQKEAWTPLNLILSAGRGDAGEVRFGGGVAFTFPVLRKNQTEVARAEADAERAQKARAIAAAALAARAKGFVMAYDVARKALATIDQIAIPAAESVVDASVTAWKAGKLDLSRVFLARRDLGTARERRLDLAASGFSAYAELVGLVGGLP